MTMNSESRVFSGDIEQVPTLPVLEYGAYEILCNRGNRGARKNGILSSEIYQAVVDDGSTLFAEVDGVLVPAVIDITYGLGMGYDEERSRLYAADMDAPVSVLCLPVGELDEEVQSAVATTVATNGPRALYVTDYQGQDVAALYRAFDDLGVEYTEKPLEDARCKEGSRQASLSLYVCDALSSAPEASQRERVGLSEVQEYFDQEVLPQIADPANATLLEQGARLTECQRDMMWQLYLKKFQYLGENHPISMEDSKEDFLALLTDERTMVSTRYVDGEPICFTYFTDNFDDLYWLNQDYLRALNDAALPHETPIFFPGVVSSGIGGYAAEVIKAFAEYSGRKDFSARVIFENTNLSERYVPSIVYKTIRSDPSFTVEWPERLDVTSYRLIVI